MSLFAGTLVDQNILEMLLDTYFKEIFVEGIMLFSYLLV